MIQPLLLLSMPGPFMSGILILTVIVMVYSFAKALMRYLDKNKKDKP